MKVINGLSTVNDGTVKQFTNSKYVYTVEIMGEGYSSHPTNMVATYFMDEGVKTSLVLFAARTGEAKFIVYKFSKKDQPEHYYSRAYLVAQLPKKYKENAGELIRAYSQEFNNNRMAFDYPRSWGLV